MNDDVSDVSPFLTLVIFQLVILVFWGGNWYIISRESNVPPQCHILQETRPH